MRNRKQKKRINIGVDRVDVTQDEQERVLIKLEPGLTLYHGEDDLCLYRSGFQMSCPERGPGNEASCFLGRLYSLQPGVIDLQFRNHNGVFVRVNANDPDLEKNLKNLAVMMLKRADEFAKIISNP